MEYLPIGLGILGGEFCYGIARPVHILIEAKTFPVGERHGYLQIGVNVLAAIFFEFKVLIDWCIIYHHMVDAMGIVIEAAERHLFGGKPTTYFEVPLQHYHLLSRFAQVGSHAEPVGAATYDDEVIFVFRHLNLL
jgi:hypothetical protein